MTDADKRVAELEKDLRKSFTELNSVFEQARGTVSEEGTFCKASILSKIAELLQRDEIQIRFDLFGLETVAVLHLDIVDGGVKPSFKFSKDAENLIDKIADRIVEYASKQALSSVPGGG